MFKSKQAVGIVGRGVGSLVRLAATTAALSALLAVTTACSSSDSEAAAGNTAGAGGADAQTSASEPGSPAEEKAVNKRDPIDAMVRAYLTNPQARAQRDVTAPDAGAAQPTDDARVTHTPAFAATNKILDLPNLTPTKYPLSADGKYYNVNVLRRNYPPPTAHATFANGAGQLGQAGPQFVVDGHDSAFTWYPAVAGDTNASSTLTVDMGQYFSVGAIRPLYQPLGAQVPSNQRIRLATKLGPNADWQEVFNGLAAAPDSTISLNQGVPARFLELTMTGLGANLLELFVYPSANTSPPPTSADGYDLGSLAAASSTVNENYHPLGTQWPQNWPQGGFRPKSEVWGPTGDAVATVDLGAEYPVSRLSLGFFWSSSWANGGRLEVGTAANTFTNLYDSGPGHRFLDDFAVGNDFTFPTQPVRYIRTTDYFDGNEPSPGVLWSVLSFTDPPPHVGYFPLSADGKYFVVNLIRRPVGDVQPTASVVYSNGAVANSQPQNTIPGNLVDGDDADFVFRSPAVNMPDPTATLTVDLGQVQKLGAVRQIYGSYPPANSIIRIAPTLSGPWQTVVSGPVATPDSITSFDGFDARYVELTMKGTTTYLDFAQVIDLMVYPSSAADPAPSSGSHLDLTYLTGISYTLNANLAYGGGALVHTVDGAAGCYIKSAAQGGTGDGTVTVDPRQQFQISEVDLSFDANRTWAAGGKLEVDDGAGNWQTLFDSGHGTPLGRTADGTQKIVFSPHTTRYLRLTGYFDPAVSSGLLTGIEVFGDSVVACVPNCSAQTCGGHATDGCGKSCPGACTSGQVGCASNADCSPNLQCISRSPDPQAPRVCVALTCGSTCSTECPCVGASACSTSDQCASGFTCASGLCACQSDCTGKTCGAGDGCGGVCEVGCGPGDACQAGGCAPGLTCSSAGVCSGPNIVLSNTRPRPFISLPTDDDAILPSATSAQGAPGRLAGIPGVDPGGAFSYRIPISVPAGRAGMQPHLAFNYSSSNGNGSLGVGWSLDGLSSITRCRKLMAREGTPGSVKVKSNYCSSQSPASCQDQYKQYVEGTDSFCLDGEKLVNIGGTAINPEFRTEHDSFAKIVATYDGQYWPSRFTVWRRDGTIAFYQGGAVASGVDSRDTVTGEPTGHAYSGVLSWPQAVVQDRFGNAVKYNYAYGDAGSAAKIIQSIEYTTCAEPSICPYGSSATRLVQFNYESRTDYLSHWVAGLNAGIAVRLNSVDVLTQQGASTTPVRSYKLAYDASAATSRARLISMTLCDGRDACEKPTLFHWGSRKGSDFRRKWHVIGPDPSTFVSAGQCSGTNPDTDCFLADYQTASMEASPDPRNPFLIGDFDGNGTDDILSLTNDLTQSDPDHTPNAWLDLSHADGGSVTFETLRVQSGDITSGRNWEGARVVDIDQDGQAEVIVRNAHGDQYETQDFLVYRYSSLIHDFVLVQASSAALTVPTPSNHAPRGAPTFLDVDGDGVLDYFYDSNRLLSDGVGHAYFISHAITSTTSLLPAAYGPDSSLDYIPTAADQHLYEEGRCRLQPIDYAGRGYSSPALVCTETDTTTSFADMNGDGLSDIVTINRGAQPGASVRLSTGVEVPGEFPGGAFSPVVRPEAQALPATILASTQFASPVPEYFWDQILHNRIVDMNADGLADIVQFQTPTLSEPPAIWLTENRASGPTVKRVNLPYTQRRVGDVVQQVGDFNGDGLPDIVQAVDFEYDPPPQRASLQFLIQDPSNRDDVLTEVESDQVELADVQYTSGPTEQLGPGGGATVGPADGLFRPLKGLTVVTQSTFVKGGASDHYSYYYVDPAADTHGRGFLGFGAIIRANFTRGTKVTTLYDNTRYEGTLPGYHVFPYAFVPQQVDVATGIEALADLNPTESIIANVVETRYEHSEARRRTHVLNSGLGLIGYGTTFFVEDYSDSNTKKNENGGVYYAATTSRVYDEFSNVTNLKSFDGDEETSTVSQFNNDSSNWLIGQLQNVATLHTRTGFSGPDYAQTNRPQLREYSWGTLGELHTITSTPGSWWTKTFTIVDHDPAGLVRAVVSTDAYGNQRAAAFDYSADGVYREHSIDGLGHDTWVGYHSGLGVPLIDFDVNGVETTYKYDGFGRPRMLAPTRAPVTTIRYEQAAGSLATITSRNPGTTVRSQYNSYGRLVATSTVIGGRTSTVLYSIDSLGRLNSTSTPRFDDQPTQVDTHFYYDNLGNVRFVTRPDGSTVTVNLLDPLTTETVVTSEDDKTKDTVVTKTPDGLVQSVRENAPGESVTVRGIDYVYGQNKSLYQLKELGGPTTTYYSYGLPKPAFVIDSERGQSNLLYDGFFDLVKMSHTETYPATERYEYDNLGRQTLIATTMPDPANPTQPILGETRYTYDIGLGALGRLSTASSEDGVVTRYTYTAEGLLRRKEYDSGPDAFVIDYDRDDFGRISHVDYPQTSLSRFGVDLGYNDAAMATVPDGSLSSVTHGNESYWSEPARGATGIAEWVRLGPDLTQTLNIDPATRAVDDITVAKTDGTPVYGVSYDYYVGGNVKTRTDALAGTDEQYEYDAYDQLSKWSYLEDGQPRTINYSYDQLGNQLTTGAWRKTFGGEGFSPHQLATQVAPLVIKRYSYDPLGRQTSWSENLAVQRTVTYTTFDLPRTVTTTQPSARTVSYTYDADQHRFSQTAGTSTTTYVDDLYERRVDNATGATTHVFYVFADGKRIAQVVQSGSDRTVVWLYSDALGTVTASSKGEQRQVFSPWGERIAAGAAGLSALADVTTGFTDQEHDDGGLINMRGRIYDAGTRIFLTPDPIVGSPLKSGGWNKYTYVLNNPLKYVDPSGFDGEPVDAPGEPSVVETTQWVDPVVIVVTESGNSFNPGESSDSTYEAGAIETQGAGLVEDPILSLEPGFNPFPDAGGSPCGGSYTCGDLPGLDAIRNSSNVLNHPDAYADRAALDRAKNAEYDTPLQHPLVGPEDILTAIITGGGTLAEKLLAENVAKGIAAEEIATIDTAAVRFSQDSVAGTFRNGTSLNDAAAALRAGGKEAGAAYPPIRLFERNGSLFTLDNRRLLVFSEAGAQVPFRMATEAELAKEFTSKFSTTAAQGWGQFITVRP